jgi:hypothetical protein
MKTTLQLTGDQQKQIKEATGKIITEESIDPASTRQLTDQELEPVSGGELSIQKQVD